MSRNGAIRRIGNYFESDGFFDDLARRVAIHTESQEPDRRPEPIPNSVRAALAPVTRHGGAGAPAIDPAWGEPGLTPAA